MKAPVIFLTFANDPDNHLALLKREEDSITRALRHLDTMQQIKLVVKTGIKVEDVFEIFSAYKGEVAIFHYGGHASGTALQFEGKGAESSAAQATGLAKFLGQQDGLQLVFLNGCATGPQVELLLRSGVPAVIATSTKIQDEMATEFAEQFYAELKHYGSIQKAFDTATFFVESKYQEGERPSIELHRGLGMWEEAVTRELPWSLFTSDSAAKVLEWTIPHQSHVAMVASGRTTYEQRPEVNDIIIDTLWEELTKYSPGLNAAVNADEPDISDISREIVDCFPLPIGEHLRKLMARSKDPGKPLQMELYSEERLYQLYYTYRATTQFLAFILLSRLWDEKFANPKLEIDSKDVSVINSFFALNEQNYAEYNYLTLIGSITDYFDRVGISYFLDELKDLKAVIDENHKLSIAARYLEAVHSDILNNAIDASKLEELCISAEEHLSNFLLGVAWLAQYRLSTIKNIDIEKPRHEVAKYRHTHIDLRKAFTGEINRKESGKIFKNFSEDKSVQFLKTDHDEITGYLSLSPFLIDESALKKDYLFKLYVFAYQKGDKFIYHSIVNPADDMVEVSSQHLGEIYEEVIKFKANILGIKSEPEKPVSDMKSRFQRKS